MSLFKEKLELEIQEAELGTQKALQEFPPFLRFLVVLLALAIIPAYFTARGLSHGIWLSRYKQTELTAKQSFTNPLPLQNSSVTVTTIASDQYSAVIKITNPNLDLSLTAQPYQFVFSNGQKQPVYTYSGNLYLLPNQSKYLIVPTFTAPDTIAYADFQLTQPSEWQKRLQTPTVNLTTSLPTSFQQAAPPAYVVQGSFTNNSPYQLNQAELQFILFDAGGKIVGLSDRIESTIAPFENRAYKQLWPNINGQNIARVEVDAYTNTLDPANLTSPSEPSGTASDLSRPTPK